MTAFTRLAVLFLGLLLAGTATACWSTEDVAGPAPVAAKSAQVQTDVRYVSPTGNDDWDGSLERPWRTLARALPALLPGQVLYVRGGAYREQLVKLELHQGSKEQRITVRAYPGEQPVVRGLFWLQEPSYWTVAGLDVTWDSELAARPHHMVKLTGGVGWVWRGSRIWGARAGANVLIVGGDAGEPADWSFTGNCVHDLNPPRWVKRGSNITIGDMRGAGPGRVSRNLVFGPQAGRNIALGVSRRGRGAGPTDVAVTYNTVFGAGVAVALGGGTTDVRVERNILAGPRSETLLRANTLRGRKDVVSENLGVQAERFFLPRTGTLRRGAGNILVEDFRFAETSSCAGFRPATVVSAYGADAVG